ncbi:coadhesin-like [Porites lutea]|uniref:coadhesin-like n=1 Tax=Porites lutea TaxID=51062 RepID=UPI003CC5AE17
MDIAILVDTSKSMTETQRGTLTTSIDRLIDKYPVSAKGNHYAFVTFDRYAKIRNKFNNRGRYNKTILNDLIKTKVRISKGLKWGTRSDIALYLAAKELFAIEGGDRADAKNILLVFTDGLQRIARRDKVPFKDFSNSTKKLENEDVSIVVVGILGKQWEKKEYRNKMKEMAGKKGKVLRYPDFEILTKLFNEVLDALCPVNGGYSKWTSSECSATCGEGVKTLTRTCTNPPPSNGGKNCSELGQAMKNVSCNEQACPFFKYFTCFSAVDGGYTNWTISECSVSCGGGVKILTRSFTNPPPVNGGKNCDELGPANMTDSCNEQECPPPCIAGLDIGIVLDKSRSIDEENLERVIEFLADLVGKFNPAPDGDHFGLITFDKDARLVFNFSDSEYYNLDSLAKKIESEPTEKAKYVGTRTDLALIMARDQLFTEAGGDRKNSPNVMLVLTDGHPYGLPKHSNFTVFSKNILKDFEEKEVHIVVVGIGDDISTNILKLIAGENGHALNVASFHKLQEEIDGIKSSVCSD